MIGQKRKALEYESVDVRRPSKKHQSFDVYLTENDFSSQRFEDHYVTLLELGSPLDPSIHHTTTSSINEMVGFVFGSITRFMIEQLGMIIPTNLEKYKYGLSEEEEEEYDNVTISIDMLGVLANIPDSENINELVDNVSHLNQLFREEENRHGNSTNHGQESRIRLYVHEIRGVAPFNQSLWRDSAVDE